MSDEKNELSKHQGELVLSIIFILGSLWIMYRSVLMSIDVYNRTQPDVYTLPGIFPFIVAVLIILCSVSVILHAVKGGARLNFISFERFRESLKRKDMQVFLVLIGWMMIYVFLLMEYLPFEIATFIFIFFLFRVFKAASLWRSVLISALFSLIVVYFFAVIVRTPFPHTFF